MISKSYLATFTLKYIWRIHLWIGFDQIQVNTNMIIIKLSLTSEVIELGSHKVKFVFKNPLFHRSFINLIKTKNESIWMLILWRYIFDEINYDIKGHFYALQMFCSLFTLRPSDLITTLTFVLNSQFLSLLEEIFKTYHPN